ncbi:MULTISPECIES: hypothetical protein [Rhodanobacter]|uniref:hypothetical protein n=1 Tax=Rhodanobacter TaxID=75309 RepID=UPI0004819C62|nr:MULTISPECIES: hypothetical protein [Rhodanobacter]KZC19148.1 hypothetical protein RHOFW104R3_32815 [Rhodanobacter denitrificans]UJJ51173.1 hypothetical protein LRK52_00315 [Rhodanobacter denitrificans]UJM90386.1 hypothetical protein LRK24_00320 [Rhodanobacter denitrificans]UJM93919.1 hypothetical protein LRK32_00320 [Rhodanobacter denitrificans]UJM97449.1 hypothetical protein LRK44_00320 [Rhodanobacter denitrificans]
MPSLTAEVVEVKVWKLESGSVNDYAPLVFGSDKDVASGMFDTSGASLSWSRKPRVEVFVEPGKKKPKPLADVSALTPGALVMNDKAKVALEPFLSRFGQFLELDCAGEPRWFYNVTSVIPCIDEAHSAKRPSGSVVNEEFFEDRLPVDAAVFKDPLTAAAVLYVNEAGKAALEAIITEAAIVGVAFVELGPPPKKPRPRS